jgi:hypothetical protein
MKNIPPCKMVTYDTKTHIVTNEKGEVIGKDHTLFQKVIKRKLQFAKYVLQDF